MEKRPRSFTENLDLCLASRCPVCAAGKLFVPLNECTHPREYCYPVRSCECCGFEFQREPGYYTTVFVPFLPILSNGIGVVIGLGFWLIFSTSTAFAITAGAVASFISFFVCMRPAIAAFIAFDHTIDPPE